MWNIEIGIFTFRSKQWKIRIINYGERQNSVYIFLKTASFKRFYAFLDIMEIP